MCVHKDPILPGSEVLIHNTTLDCNMSLTCCFFFSPLCVSWSGVFLLFVLRLAEKKELPGAAANPLPGPFLPPQQLALAVPGPAQTWVHRGLWISHLRPLSPLFFTYWPKNQSTSSVASPAGLKCNVKCCYLNHWAWIWVPRMGSNSFWLDDFFKQN